ncbi:hypothetical protein IGK80_001113 [Enterococcus sp. DIV0609]|uniref:hypothetical protein n=1 Tax=Enterococcus TaxID=1350 RepID=UPI0008781383|nr:hypothetical protein [Enterococcus faecalis]OFA14385.1 hypothetical protein ENFAE_04320 [Enterococcus faecalis]
MSKEKISEIEKQLEQRLKKRKNRLMTIEECAELVKLPVHVLIAISKYFFNIRRMYQYNKEEKSLVSYFLCIK